MKKHHSITASLGLGCLLIVTGIAPAAAQESEVKIERIQDVIKLWDKDQHLYVDGDLGVDSQRYRELEEWLDEHGPNWTVVLLHDSHGEEFRTADGRSFVGMAAVEYALGRGLSNQTDFGQLEDSRTGERNGAVFMLFLQERKFSYIGSDAQDRRGLGESHWIGKLDRPAFRAMRSGGRILDAVKDTVSSIGSRLDKALAAEARDAAQRDRDLAAIRNAIDLSRNQVDQVASLAATLRDNRPTADGDLTKPPVDPWRAKLTELDQSLTAETMRSIDQRQNAVNDEISGYLKAFAAYEDFPADLAKVEEELAAVSVGPNNVAATDVVAARKQLKTARDEHGRGDRVFRSSLAHAKASLVNARNAIAAEQSRLRRAQQRAGVIRTAAAVTCGALALAGAAFLTLLNRRRKPARDRARKALSEQETSTKNEMDRVLDLFRRGGELLGSEESLVDRGYEGETKQITEQTLQDVDNLMVISNEVDRVMDEARDLIEPDNPVDKMMNMFSGARYNEGVDRITGKPLRFTRDRGLPVVMEVYQESLRREGIEPYIGDDPEEISMTFEDVFSVFRSRAVSVGKQLDTIQRSFLEIQPQLETLQEQINELTRLDTDLTDAAAKDEYFETPSLFEQLLPSAQTDHDNVEDHAISDPVKAVSTFLPAGLRKTNEGLAIARTIRACRETVMPELTGHAATLKSQGYETAWIHDTLLELGEIAEQLFATGDDRGIAAEAADFSDRVQALGQRARRSVELAQQLADATPASIEKLAQARQSGREHVAQQLSISMDEALHEPNLDPDDFFTQAQQHWEAAQTALHRGGVESSAASLESCETALARAHEIIEETRDVMKTFDEVLSARRCRCDEGLEHVPQYRDSTAHAGREYTEPALRFHAADESYPDPNADLVSHLESAANHWQESHRWIDEAARKYGGGGVLMAADLLDQAEGSMDVADERFREIDQHIERLRGQQRANVETLSHLGSRTQQMQSDIKDFRTQRETMSAFEQAVRETQDTAGEVEGSRGMLNPFNTQRSLMTAGTMLDDVEALIAADREAHAEATRAVEGCGKKFSSAESLVQRAQTDQIPDSPATTRAIRGINTLESDYNHLQRRLSGQHDDWNEVDNKASKLHVELAQVSAELQGELDRARQSMAVFQDASNSVFEATRWTGGWGVRIFGAPGARELDRARAALNSGDYAAMIQLSESAASLALAAIRSAQAEVARKQRAADRRAEEARRRQLRDQMARQRRSRPTIGIGLPGGGRRSGGGSSSRPRSNDSGAARSGW